MKWEEMANEGDHYRLAFDRNNTWSQKYNIIWDKMWNLNIFPNNVISKEKNYRKYEILVLYIRIAVPYRFI